MKTILCLLIRLYQKTPTRLHTRCRFNPTCSEYMLLCIQKFGVFSGVEKGIKRLRRCRYPNGGDDWP